MTKWQKARPIVACLLCILFIIVAQVVVFGLLLWNGIVGFFSLFVMCASSEVFKWFVDWVGGPEWVRLSTRGRR